MREQLPLLLEGLTTWLKPLLAQLGIKVALDPVSIKAFVFKYLNANVEDALGSLVSSVRMGGSVAMTVLGNLVLIPVALF
mgnify:FL=1